VPNVPSLALGSGEVTLQAMTAAYAAFINHGSVPKPILIRRVEDHDGTVLFEGRPSSTRAISDTTAFLMSTMMADVINAGTAARARSLGFTLAGRRQNRTTNDFNDAWFIGFTPKLATGVWVGFDQPRTILPNGFAADIAVPVWAKFMKIATQATSPTGFRRRPASSRPACAGSPESWRPSSVAMPRSSTSTASTSAVRRSTPNTFRAGPSRRRTATGTSRASTC
jgi:penicillin-binding protein 1A